MEEKRKIRKTKNAFYNALLKILKKKKIERVTVTELCKEADLNRTTFYCYYNTPEECFEELENLIFSEIIEEIHNSEIQSVRDFFEIYFSFVKGNQDFFRYVHRTDINNRNIVKLVDEFLKIKGNQMDELFVRYNCYGFFGLMNDWLNGRFPCTPEDIMSLLEKADERYRSTKK